MKYYIQTVESGREKYWYWKSYYSQDWFRTKRDWKTD